MNTLHNDTPQVAPVLSIEGLSVRVAGTSDHVVRNVGFDLWPGETLCVVGESGSGKSVTALSIMGLLPKGALVADAGTIRLEGEDVLQCTPARLRELRATRMAMVFQEPMTALNPVITVGRQIDEVLRVHGVQGAAERKARVLAMLRDVHLPDVERTYYAYPHQLSGGQRQRIVISMALVLDPKVLIADEPTTALDVTTQRQILALMRELQKKHGTALLFITHDFGVVAELADRIVVMNQGEVVETGAREQTLARPRAAYTRMLISSVPSLVPRERAPPSDAIVLDIDGLHKTFSQRRLFGRGRTVAAAQDVRLTVRRGEILGLVGESGSGKSTVARCVVRLIEPSSGAIRIDGIDVARLSRRALRPLRQHVQIVFQDPYRSLDPRQRIGESLIEGPVNFGVRRATALAKAAELLRVVGLSAEAMRRYPHQFSGGQRQRICIARALALEPALLVADEAVSALDVSVQAQVLALIEQIRVSTGIAVLFITHDLRVAAQICDTIVVMQHGHVVESGPATTILASPTRPYTRALIDAAPGRHWDFRHFRPADAGTGLPP
ncbi:MAG: ABC transporter ATP-binding protein [Burkholderiales bacterium]|nr:ABC transporter ATP-binding protein [Burkholderiales bacterium]